MKYLIENSIKVDISNSSNNHADAGWSFNWVEIGHIS